MFGGAGTETAAQLTAATTPPLERAGRKVTGAAGRAAKGLSLAVPAVASHSALIPVSAFCFSLNHALGFKGRSVPRLRQRMFVWVKPTAGHVCAGEALSGS